MSYDDACIDRFESAERRLAKAEAERDQAIKQRDAAIADLTALVAKDMRCRICEFYLGEGQLCAPARECYFFSQWKWRGVQA